MGAASVSRETAHVRGALSEAKIEKLNEFVTLLDRWRRITDLTSERAFKEVWTRHIDDSLFLYLTRPSALRWLDLGSGAGFPAVVLSIALDGLAGAEVHCVESDGRKCAFLRTVAESIGLQLKIHNVRAEHLQRIGIDGVDVITARAFSSVQRILDLADPFFRKGAIALLPRGKTYQSEIEQADLSGYDIETNRLPHGGAILQISAKLKGP